MSQSLTVQVSDQTYDAIRAQAQTAGVSELQVAADALEREFRNGKNVATPGAPATEAEKQAARERFERHFGVIDLGSPNGSDNDAIDADLAREYASNHEAK